MTTDDIRVALDWIGHIDNYSGQIVQLDGSKNILCEFGCPHCSEVGGKNAEEYGNALTAIARAAREYIAYQQIVLDSFRSVDEEMRGGAVFENPLLAVSSRIALAHLDMCNADL